MLRVGGENRPCVRPCVRNAQQISIEVIKRFLLASAQTLSPRQAMKRGSGSDVDVLSNGAAVRPPPRCLAGNRITYVMRGGAPIVKYQIQEILKATPSLVESLSTDMEPPVEFNRYQSADHLAAWNRVGLDHRVARYIASTASVGRPWLQLSTLHYPWHTPPPALPPTRCQ
jgi:hypothetical protein